MCDGSGGNLSSGLMLPPAAAPRQQPGPRFAYQEEEDGILASSGPIGGAIGGAAYGTQAATLVDAAHGNQREYLRNLQVTRDFLRTVQQAPTLMASQA